MGTLLFLLPLLAVGIQRSSCLDIGGCDNQYRNLDGYCTNLVDSSWGSARQFQDISASALATGHASPPPSRLLADQHERDEAVTEWLGAWTSFIKADMLDIKEDGVELRNDATPVLDLSNLYGTVGDTISIRGSVAIEDVGERIVWQLMRAEHERLSHELQHLNHGWGSAKVEQEARKILIAEYQNIIVKEVVPLLVGYNNAVDTLPQANETFPSPLSPEELLIGLHASFAFGTPDIQGLGSALYSLEAGWSLPAFRMLNLRQRIPAGGIAYDRLSDISDAQDVLGRVELKNYPEIREQCGLPEDDIYEEVLYRVGLPGGEIKGLLGVLSEDSQWGAVLSASLSCLFNNMLLKVIGGDRFWYSKPGVFTRDQLDSVQSVYLSTLLCENVEKLRKVQPSAFMLADDALNHEMKCEDLPKLELEHWSSEERVINTDEEGQIEFALIAATENLLQFRKFEYSLYQDNYVAPRRSSQQAEASVTRPSIMAMNKMNNSALFEYVTYEFMKRPQLAKLLTPTITTSGRRKRSPRTFDIVTYTPYRPNRVYVERVQNKLDTMPSNNHFYTTVTVTRASDSQSNSFPKSSSFSSPSSQSSFAPHSSFKTSPSSHFGSSSSSDIIVTEKCLPADEICDESSKYRTYSGRCNNLANPSWGESNAPHRRLLPPEYDDAISRPRQRSVRGSKLPNPRKVSQEIHDNVHSPDPKFTLMLMQWGQFLDHDITHTPNIRGHDNSILDCRSCKSNRVHPACDPISIPEGDSFFSYNRVDPKCIPFTRSVAGQQELGPRQQLNQLTSYIDASMVYGSDKCMMAQVREPNSFLLKVFNHPDNTVAQPGKYKDLPPRTRDNHECFSPTGECFLAGDSRINEHPGLTAMHTIMVREHNTIAAELAGINPHWSTDRVFEETRRIIGAQIQHVTYNEFVPRVIGRATLRTFDLNLRTSYYYDYDDKCSANTFNEFATAAFRFGHSAIRSNLTAMSEGAMMGRAAPRELSLRHHFNNPDIIMDAHMVDELMRGLIMTPMETIDNRVTDEVANHLFEEDKKPKSGMDLVALNLQRGRDHGIPGYNKYRELCELPRANTFLDFQQEIRLDLIYRMQKIYKHPDDVDLFTGLLAETKLNGALTGPTLACLLGLQFSHLRKCDRHWYETGDETLKFSEDQLAEIRSVSMAGLICRNMDENTMIPRAALDQMDRLTNPMVDCERTIRQLDLSHWKDSKSYSLPTSPSSPPPRPSTFPSSPSKLSNTAAFSAPNSIFTTRTTCKVENRVLEEGEGWRKSPCTQCTCTAKGLNCEKIDLYNRGLTCLKLVKEYSIKEVEEDKSCLPQCRII